MKIVGLVILALIAYFVWRFVVRGDALVVITRDSGKKVTGAVTRVVPGKELVVEVDNPSKEIRITEISLARALVAGLGISAPEGFREEALPLTAREREDPESVAFVERFNREHVRWVGSHVVPQEGRAQLVFPIARAAEASGFIHFRYEARWGIGGSISSFRARLGSPEPERAPQPPSSPGGRPAG